MAAQSNTAHHAVSCASSEQVVVSASEVISNASLVAYSPLGGTIQSVFARQHGNATQRFDDRGFRGVAD